MWKRMLDIMTGRAARRAALEAEVTRWLDRSAFDARQRRHALGVSR